MEGEISRLSLLSPLYYVPGEKPESLGFQEETGGVPGEEELFCFKLDETQDKSIEPDKKKLLADMVFYGKAVKAAPEESSFKLPEGSYLFLQKREMVSMDGIIDLAVEMQSEGLWQRLKLEGKLYIRRLYEDQRWVTQLFRPYRER